MSEQSNNGTRSSFASRLLAKAMTERNKTVELKKVVPADAAKYADSTPVEVKEVALAGKE